MNVNSLPNLMTMTALAIYSQFSIDANHLTGPRHPEQPARTSVIDTALRCSGITDQSILLKPRMANDEDILRCHSKEYLDRIERKIDRIKYKSLPDDGSILLPTGDTNVCSKSLMVARYAAGAALEGVDALMNGSAVRVFCNIRPPGHHAESSCGQGFCLLNNAAIAACYAQDKYNVGKIVIIDWDVHHGNGTQQIFYKNPDVFYFSTHRYGTQLSLGREAQFYPGTGSAEEIGEGPGTNYTLNCPIDPDKGSPRELVLQAFREKLVPAMHTFKPELVIISAGFDAHERDPLGGFNLTEKDFAELTHIVRRDIADKYAGGKILSLLEGGYNLEALAASVQAHVTALIDEL